LISSRVFLTAEHCDLGVSRVEVTFASTFDRATSATYWGTWYGDPDYNQTSSDPHDLAVVVLDKAVRGITPARLPAEDSLSGLAGDQQFTPVGYGAQSVTSGAGGKTFHYADVRDRTVGTLNTLTKAWLEALDEPVARRRQHLLRRRPRGGRVEAVVDVRRPARRVAGDRRPGDDVRLRGAGTEEVRAARAFLGQFVTLP
jgi:hypothetical protein